MTRLAILGFGLIGGSIAQALTTRRPGAWTITAWSRSMAGPRAALDAGHIDAVADDPTTRSRRGRPDAPGRQPVGERGARRPMSGLRSRPPVGR